jgi:hypothetical protein
MHLSAVALRLAGMFLLAAAAPAAASDPARAPADGNSAADANGAPTKAEAKADDGEKTVCRRVPHTGTMIGWKRICKPKSAWRAGEG